MLIDKRIVEKDYANQTNEMPTTMGYCTKSGKYTACYDIAEEDLLPKKAPAPAPKAAAEEPAEAEETKDEGTTEPPKTEPDAEPKTENKDEGTTEPEGTKEPEGEPPVELTDAQMKLLSLMQGEETVDGATLKSLGTHPATIEALMRKEMLVEVKASEQFPEGGYSITEAGAAVKVE